MHIKCRYFSRKNLATGGVEPPPQMPLTVNIEGVETVILFCDLVVGDKSVFYIGYGMELVNSRM